MTHGDAPSTAAFRSRRAIASQAWSCVALTLATVAAYQPINGVTVPGASMSRGSGWRSCRAGHRQKVATKAANSRIWTLAPQMLPSIGSQSSTIGISAQPTASRRQTATATSNASSVHTIRTRSSGSAVSGTTNGSTNGG